MSELADNSVQCVVTSPPFWGLRKYAGLPDLIWGGDKDCRHEWVEEIKPDDAGQGHYTGTTRWQHIAKEAQDKGVAVRDIEPTAWAKGGFKSGFCSLCGSWKGSYGLEPTPEMYIQHTIEILREIRRVLRKDGVVFLNLGDSYAGSGSPGGDFRDGKGGDEYLRPYNRKGGILKAKDLCLIPFKVAIAAQEDGWWCRSIIIWSKPNPMPESVNGWRWERHRVKIKSGIGGRRSSDRDVPLGGISTDTDSGQALWQDCPGCPKCSLNDGYVLCKGSWRPTESHEYIIMLTKTDTYYCDADALRESAQNWGTRDRSSYRGGTDDPMLKHHGMENINFAERGRNIRTVWEFPTQPGPSGAVRNFAVFPEKLPELCIKAATPEVGCCSKCGAPWARIIEKQRARPQRENWRNQEGAEGRSDYSEAGGWYDAKSITLGWQPTCKCNADKVPSIVLDPFLGAGTTLKVAKKLGRRGVGYELSEAYCALSLDRNRQMAMELIPRG